MSRPTLHAVVVATIGLGTAAHAESRPTYGRTVEGTLLGAPTAVDPNAAQSHAELAIAELVFDTLYRIDPAGVVVPHLAAGPPDLDAAKTTATIPLRKNVRFHDGSVMAAADVAASLERARTAGTTRWPLAAIHAIRVAGDDVELTLRAPVAELATLLALPQLAVTRAGKPPTERAMIGSGPFVVEQIDRGGKRIKLKAFDDGTSRHFAGRPYVDHLVLRWYDTPAGEVKAFEIGELQVSARGDKEFPTSQPRYAARNVEGPAALLVFVGFGRAHPDVLADRSFRRALDLALARGALSQVTSGETVVPTREPVPGAALAAGARSGDLAAAQAALAQAARRVAALAPARLGQLKLEILVEDTRPDDREIAENVAYALGQLAIGSTITAVSAPVLRDRVARGTSDLWIGQAAGPITSATLWWSVAFAAGGDEAMAKAVASGSVTAADAQQRFAAQLPIAPLVFRAVKLWHRSDVRGLKLDTSGMPCFADMYLFGDPVKAARGKP